MLTLIWTYFLIDETRPARGLSTINCWPIFPDAVGLDSTFPCGGGAAGERKMEAAL